ncbi:MAG TPA: MarR family transcriptional regulator [Bacteroidales bacterium]|jgi:DNA-binding IscR family transcriptional regulator|nr:MarR family transcriptional regulator [Bacteroidales bacterium]
MEIKTLVLQALESAGTPLKSGQIAEKSGVDKKEVDKAIKALVKENKVHSPKACFYDLSK